MNNDFKIGLSQYYFTGVPGIDAQHKELSFLLENFVKSLTHERLSSDAIRATFQEIFGLLRSHFATEENLMEMIAFPKIAEHKAQHKNFVNMLAGELKILENTENAKISHFINSYRHIALTHVAVFDREYVNFIERLMAARKRPHKTTVEVQALAG